MTAHEIFPFFTGCQRSGTTLIRVIFNAHPEIAIPGESHFIPEFAARRQRYERPNGFRVRAFMRDLRRHERFVKWNVRPKRVLRALRRESIETLEDALRTTYATFARKRGKPRYGDKTPRYATQIPLLARMFPEARFVHVIRDGRNVALSVREMDWGPDRLDLGALYWRERVEAARAAGRTLGPDRYLEYRHEDLIEDPEGVVRRICAFLDLPFDEAMLTYHERRKPRAKQHLRHLSKPPTKGLREWQEQMSHEDARVFELLVGDLLADLGYECVTDRRTLSGRAERRARAHALQLHARDALRRSSFGQRIGGTGIARAVRALRRPPE